MKPIYFLALLMFTSAQAETIKPVVGGFVDFYWASSSGKLSNFERPYTTQAVRNNEFNINLVYIDAKIEQEKVHGRLALQAGTSVQSNYAGEPNVGSNSGPSLSRNVQEAYAGYRIADATWVDAGIMLSHIGLESFISKDNTTYTRSLVADFSPYYQTGVRVTHAFNSKVSGQVLVLNGWQNISENNQNKAVGSQLSVQATDELTIVYNTFFGNERGFRQFHDLIVKYKASPKFDLAAQADIGDQSAIWYGTTLIAHSQFTDVDAASIRFERYVDDKNMIVTTPDAKAFRAWSASLGYDRALSQQLTFRNEIKRLIADQYQENVLVSSIGFSF